MATVSAADTTTNDPSADDNCIPEGEFDSEKDYFPIKANTNRTSLSFTVEYKKHYKIVTNTNADPLGPSGPAKHITILYQCGAPVPSECNEEYHSAHRTVCIQVPVQKVGISDTVGITFLEILGVIERVRFVESMEYVTSPCLQKWADYLLETEGHDISGSLEAEAVNAQRASVDVHFQTLDNMVGDAFGPNTVYTSESFDHGALNRPDWLGFFATFFNMEEKYHTYMAGLTKRWSETTALTADISAKPVVAVVNYLDYYKPNITYEVLLSPYMNDSILAAGGIPKAKYDFDNVTAFKEYISDVDVIIVQSGNMTMTKFLDNFGMTSEEPLAFLQNQAVYTIDKRMNKNFGLDWFESVLAKPDILVRDLVTAIHPGVLKRERTFLRNLYSEESVVLTANDCEETFDAHREAEAAVAADSGVVAVKPVGTLLATAASVAAVLLPGRAVVC